jgi:ubiquinone/menaquinone biosynthesis C-methylase UbiE
MSIQGEDLKKQVHDYWNRQSCDTHIAASSKFSREYFEEIERFRYRDQPCIHAFAQFTRYHGKRVIEVGFGAGTDFIQWSRAGAIVSGIDLTEEALANLSHRIEIYGLPKPERIQTGDAENLPFESNCFDLGYSFGVLHHSPNTGKALAELVRVVRPGGEIKVMLYNLHSFCVYKAWVKHALLHGRPWKSLASIVSDHIESPGTKAYTRAGLREIFAKLPVKNIEVRSEINSADYLAFSAIPPLNLFCRMLLRLGGYNPGWKLADYTPGAMKTSGGDETGIRFVGNRLGWFHCISAAKLGS